MSFHYPLMSWIEQGGSVPLVMLPSSMCNGLVILGLMVGVSTDNLLLASDGTFAIM